MTDGRGIEERRLLIRDANRIRFVDRRDFAVLEEKAETGDREVYMRMPVAQVRSER